MNKVKKRNWKKNKEKKIGRKKGRVERRGGSQGRKLVRNERGRGRRERK